LIEYLSSKDINIILQPLDESIESKGSKIPQENNLIKDLWPNEKQVKILFNWIWANKKKLKLINSGLHLQAIRNYYLNPRSSLRYRCFVGQKNLIICPDGKITFCFKTKSIGNIKNSKIKQILLKAKKQRCDLHKCQKYCRIIGCNILRGFKEILLQDVK